MACGRKSFQIFDKVASRKRADHVRGRMTRKCQKPTKVCIMVANKFHSLHTHTHAHMHTRTHTHTTDKIAQIHSELQSYGILQQHFFLTSVLHHSVRGFLCLEIETLAIFHCFKLGIRWESHNHFARRQTGTLPEDSVVARAKNALCEQEGHRLKSARPYAIFWPFPKKLNIPMLS